jgi:hypothetical protein
MPVISALGRERQEDCDVRATLGYIAGLCLKKQKQKTTNKQKMDLT